MADWRRTLGEAVAQVPRAELTFDEPMARHTSFRIGGPADAWVAVGDEPSLHAVLRFCAEWKLDSWMLGRGTNVLVSDQGLHGVVIGLAGDFLAVRHEGETVRAGGAALLDDVAEEAKRAGLDGFEFLAGIPGTAGGGLATNAGAFGSSLSDVVERVKIMDRDGAVRELGCGELKSEYRRPVIARGLVALEVTMRRREASARGEGRSAHGGSETLEDGQVTGYRSQVTGTLDEIRARRWEKQPKEPSAGSFFRNPEAGRVTGHKAQVTGYGLQVTEDTGCGLRIAGDGSPEAGGGRMRIPAGRLIEECGLKGRKVGGAQVSDRHANFIVNTGGARFRDVHELAQIVKAVVEERTGYVLEEEVRVLPETQEVS